MADLLTASTLLTPMNLTKRSDGLAEGGILDDAGPRAGGAVGAAEMPVGSGGQRTDDHAEPADSQQGQRHDLDRHHKCEGERRRSPMP